MSSSEDTHETQPYECNYDENQDSNEEETLGDETGCRDAPLSAEGRAHLQMFQICKDASAQHGSLFDCYMRLRTDAFERIIKIHDRLRQSREDKKFRLEHVESLIDDAFSNCNDLLKTLQEGVEGGRAGEP